MALADESESAQMSEPHFLELNDHALLEILDHLNENDLLSMACTCTHWQRLVHEHFKRTARFRKLNIIQFLDKYGPANERAIFTVYLQQFGQSISEIVFFYDDADINRQYNSSQHTALAIRNQWIFDAVAKYCCESLKYLRMSNVYMFFQSDQAIYAQPIFKQLHSVSMNRCYKFLYDTKRAYRLCLSERCECNLLHQENNLILVFCTSNILVNLCSPATLEHLTIKNCSLRDPFMKGFERFASLRHLHIGFLNKFQMQHFWSLANFGRVREFILDQRNFQSYLNAIAFDEFEKFVKCLAQLEVFGLYAEISAGGDNKWSVDSYARLVDIYRGRAKKLLIKFYYLTSVEDLGILNWVYAKNKNFVEICKLNDDDY